ncbi:MAG: DAK2 domain-containing protein [Anaerolineae bacterium]
MAERVPIELCDGPELVRMLSVSTAWLEHHHAPINALNVFPVPDGDTGTNMLLTMQAALQEVGAAPEQPVGEIAGAMAQGALMGARGNSGVILSQVFRGMAVGLHEVQAMGPQELARALVQGSETAYQGVIEPVEGTMLTVARHAGNAARDAAANGARLVEVLETTVLAARESVALTPTLLDVLREAGVVDAGGQGLYVILDGFLRHARGEPLEAVELQQVEPAEHLEAPSDGQMEWGYCTEFIIQGQDLGYADLREAIASMGDSALVVGDETLIKVHVHTFEPGEVLSFAAQRGVLHKIKIDNMEDQHHRYRLGGQEAQEDIPTAKASADPETVSPLVVAPGAGMARVFESLGAAAVVPGGQTMNPSTEEILAAIEAVPGRRVVVLPNNANVIMAAEQAAQASEKQVVVVPTRTLPQGVGALLAIDLQASPEDSAKTMAEAAASVRTLEVTRAVRDAEFDQVRVRKGQYLVLLDEAPVAAGRSLQKVIRQALDSMPADEGELITIYFGADASLKEAESLAARIRRWYPQQEVEIVEGSQPHYPYILSLD